MARNREDAKMYLARQLKLQAVITGVPAKHMDMDAILVNLKLDRYDMQELPPSQTFEHLCGTVGCIAGWASVYPPFVQQGIRGRTTFFDPMYRAKLFFDLPRETFITARSDELRETKGSGGVLHKRIALKRIAEGIKHYRESWGL